MRAAAIAFFLILGLLRPSTKGMHMHNAYNKLHTVGADRLAKGLEWGYFNFIRTPC